MAIDTSKLTHLEKLVSAVPADLEKAASTQGLHKLAEARYGFEINEANVAKFIGTKLASRLAEWRAVRGGVAALRQLK
jgi:hypothetical protein